MIAVALGLLSWAGGCCSTGNAPRRTADIGTQVSHSSETAPIQPCLAFPDRLEQGYTVVLPGIWGSAPLEHGIVLGLMGADVPSAIELYDWTLGPLLLVYNLRALERNREEARKIAAKIVAYQDRYPGRPVNLIGYSGGGGIAVLVLEALPPDRKVTHAILLAPTLAPDYDLEVALSHTENGIRSFHSPIDAPILMVLTMAFGTMEGRHIVAAGAIGFKTPSQLDPSQREAYSAGVAQQAYTFDMMALGHPGGHFGWTSPLFIAKRIAPLVYGEQPAETRVASAPVSTR